MASKIHFITSRKKTLVFSCLILALILLFPAIFALYNSAKFSSLYTITNGTPEKKFIRWAEFNVPEAALNRAYSSHIAAHKAGLRADWITTLALLAVKYSGNWQRYKQKDLDAYVNALREGADIKETGHKYFDYYHEVYTAVLAQYIGEHTIEVKDDTAPGGKSETTKYGLRAFYPIAAGYGISEYDDFGNSRSYGYKRRHLGHDMMGRIGTPIIAVEGGTVTELGWNQYGGWRVGIRSFDQKRYYYYAHLRKNQPFNADLIKGQPVNAGDVIGNLGMTGYSTEENVNNINVPHVHFGLQLIFDESQVKGPTEIWVDVYQLVKFLAKNKCVVEYDKVSKEYFRKYDMKYY